MRSSIRVKPAGLLIVITPLRVLSEEDVTSGEESQGKLGAAPPLRT
jgi:hypothetical protein